MDNNGTQESWLKKAWHRIQNPEGDKVIVIIVLLLILISFLAIFSSTPLLPAQESRLATMKDHGLVAILGIGLMILLYNFDIKWIKYLSQTGFLISLVLLVMLLLKVDLGFIKVETRNSATRNFVIAGLQVHVFEIVKVAMIMYLAWALNAIREDREARKERKKSDTLHLANWMASKSRRLKFMKKTVWKRVFYVYMPALIITMLVFFGSGSSAVLVALSLIALMIIGGGHASPEGRPRLHKGRDQKLSHQKLCHRRSAGACLRDSQGRHDHVSGMGAECNPGRQGSEKGKKEK